MLNTELLFLSLSCEFTFVVKVVEVGNTFQQQDGTFWMLAVRIKKRNCLKRVEHGHCRGRGAVVHQNAGTFVHIWD